MGKVQNAEEYYLRCLNIQEKVEKLIRLDKSNI